MEILKSLDLFFAKLLDKLKVSRPIIFFALQGSLGVLLSLFISDKLSIHVELLDKLATFVGLADFDTLIEVFLTGLIAAVGPRTNSIINGPVNTEGTNSIDNKENS